MSKKIVKEQKRICYYCKQLLPRSEYTPSRWRVGQHLCRKCDNKLQIRIASIERLRDVSKIIKRISRGSSEKLDKEIQYIYQHTPMMWLDDEDIKAIQETKNYERV